MYFKYPRSALDRQLFSSSGLYTHSLVQTRKPQAFSPILLYYTSFRARLVDKVLDGEEKDTKTNKNEIVD